MSRCVKRRSLTSTIVVLLAVTFAAGARAQRVPVDDAWIEQLLENQPYCIQVARTGCSAWYDDHPYQYFLPVEAHPCPQSNDTSFGEPRLLRSWLRGNSSCFFYQVPVGRPDSCVPRLKILLQPTPPFRSTARPLAPTLREAEFQARQLGEFEVILKRYDSLALEGGRYENVKLPRSLLILGVGLAGAVPGLKSDNRFARAGGYLALTVGTVGLIDIIGSTYEEVVRHKAAHRLLVWLRTQPTSPNRPLTTDP